MLKISIKPPHRKLVILAIVVSAIIIIVVFAVLALINSQVPQEETVRGLLENRAMNVPDLDIGGVKYRYRQDLMNILVMGIDQAENDNPENSSRSNGQADFLLLLTVNEKEESISMLQIDRDTITDVTMLSVLGQDGGTRQVQICLAHGFGGTRQRSSELVIQAVERLLFGVPIDRFISVNMYDIGAITDALGGIPVTINEEMEAIDPSFRKGEEVLLKGEQANRFVRQRYGIGDGSNSMRMQRQQIFLQSLEGIIAQEVNKGQKETERVHDLLSPYLFTNLSKGYTINLLSQTKDFKADTVVTLAGVHSVGVSGFMEFYPDQDELKAYVVNGFSSGVR